MVVLLGREDFVGQGNPLRSRPVLVEVRNAEGNLIGPNVSLKD